MTFWVRKGSSLNLHCACACWISSLTFSEVGQGNYLHVGWGKRIHFIPLFKNPKTLVLHYIPPLFVELHWLSSAARIKLKSLMLAYKVLNGTAPIYLNALAKAYVTTRSLRSSKDCLLAVPTPRLRQSRLLSCVVPRWWNELPSATRTGPSLSVCNKLLKTQLFREHLLACTSLYACTLSLHHHLWQSLTRGFLLWLLALMLAESLYPHT